MDPNNTLYVTEGSRGLCNIFTNIVILLIWINTTNKFQKLVVILSRGRLDDITNYCKKINNDKLFIMNDYPPGINSETIPTIKTYLKHNFLSRIHPYIINNSMKGKEINNPITLFRVVFPNKEQLLNVKKYFNPILNDEMLIKLQELQSNKGNYVSVHIRMTDFVTEILKTTADKISYNSFFNFIDKSGCNNIYLATDNKETQQAFIEKYNTRVFFCEDLSEAHETKFGGNMRLTSAESIYMDLFMCRDADKFMGTHKSTFSDFIKILRFNKKY